MDTTSALQRLQGQDDRALILLALGAIALCFLLPLILPDQGPDNGRTRYKDPDAHQ